MQRSKNIQKKQKKHTKKNKKNIQKTKKTYKKTKTENGRFAFWATFGGSGQSAMFVLAHRKAQSGLPIVIIECFR